MKTIRLFILVSLLPVFFGCAQKPVKQPTALTLTEFLKEQKSRTARAAHFSGKLNLRFESKAENVSGSGRVIGNGEKRTRLELRDPLGRIRYLLVEVPQKVSIYVPSSQVLYQDLREGRIYFKKTIGQSLSISDLRKIWLGIAPIEPGLTLEGWQWDSSRESFRTAGRKKDLFVELWVDGEYALIKEMKITTSEGSYQVDFSDLEKENLVALAHEVKLSLLRTQEKISVEWDELDWKAQGTLEDLSILDVEKDTKTIELR